jgi:uncharacterized membrane protein
VAEPPPTTGTASSRTRQPGLREVALVGAAVVVTVLAAAAATALLPREIQAVVFHTPLLILVLLGGTGAVLWRIIRTPRT